MKNIEITKARPNEAEIATKIALAAFSPPTNEGRIAFENYARAIESRLSFGNQVFLAKIDGEPIGMLELRGGVHVAMLFVLPEKTSAGVGTKLLAHVIASARQKHKQITVHAADPSISFYVKRGFRAVGRRQEENGIGYTTLSFSLKRGDILDSKLRNEPVEFFVFSGTGNTYHAAQKVAEGIRAKGNIVNLRKMEKNMNPTIAPNAVVGLAFPVACFSSYPTVMDFIYSLPEGEGRKIFMVGTMGGAGFGMEAPLRKLLLEKGYSPIASKLFVMPGNYGNKEMPEARNAARVEAANATIPGFVASLFAGTEKWKKSRSLGIPALLHKLGRSRRPWDFFYRMFPIQVNETKCNVCGRCLRLCPTGAMKMAEGAKCPRIDKKICQSCQRCVAFCPQHAIEVPGKPAVQYSFMSYEDFKNIGGE